MLQWASPKPGSGACIQEVLMHCPQISNSRAFVQESQCHPKIQKKLFTPTDQLIDHASNYLSHLLDDSKESKREELISLNNLTNLVNLTDEEKIRFIGLNEEKKNDFLVQKFKFMLILLTQEKMVDQNFYLN